jgi:hypothetical protein
VNSLGPLPQEVQQRRVTTAMVFAMLVAYDPDPAILGLTNLPPRLAIDDQEDGVYHGAFRKLCRNILFQTTLGISKMQ